MAGRQAPARHLGLDLGGTNIKWAVIEGSGSEWTETDRGQVPTHAELGPAQVVERLAQLGREATGREGNLASVGIGVPGVYDPRRGSTRMLPNLPGDWNAVPVAAYVADATGSATHLTNDARAFGLAELRLGAGRGARCMVGLTLGTGVGGVVAIDGHVHQGHDGTAGELGHQVMAIDGRPCTCGGRGCLEAYARADRIAELCGTASPEQAVERARAGDAKALAGLTEVAGYLGIGIVNMVVALTPDRVVIGGGVSTAGDLLLDPIRATVRRHVFTTDVSQVEIVAAALGTWAGAIGAAIHGAELEAT